jgi:hypothetical protein
MTNTLFSCCMSSSKYCEAFYHTVLAVSQSIYTLFYNIFTILIRCSSNVIIPLKYIFTNGLFIFLNISTVIFKYMTWIGHMVLDCKVFSSEGLQPC